MSQMILKLDLSGLQLMDSGEDDLDDTNEDGPASTTEASTPEPIIATEGPVKQVVVPTIEFILEDLD
ncbi:hypothetical protein COCNU_04G007100 [Cocos nucifera]|uniref:Uncharacterized protein n=1 Tax=Cocos nucifera TaxID=13894 RepID=A0A8K0N0M9_COCNU|nr:hypothetical protein COCNU_04G007100 [Cocos nucifera]